LLESVKYSEKAKRGSIDEKYRHTNSVRFWQGIYIGRAFIRAFMTLLIYYDFENLPKLDLNKNSMLLLPFWKKLPNF